MVRDNAVEVLDDLVDVSIRRALVNLLDRSDLSAKLQAVSAIYTFEARPMDQRLAAMLSEREPFLVSCTAFLLGKRTKGDVPVDRLRELLDSREPVVRESVAQCLARRCGQEALEWIRPLIDDPIPNVRRMACFGVGPMISKEGGAMLSTVEKAIFEDRRLVFGDPGNDLTHIAGVTEEEDLLDGDQFIQQVR